jgi:hypothetical protein
MLAVAHSITTKTCSADGCERGVDSRGLCLMHYKRAIKGGAIVPAKRPEYDATCTVDECDKPSEKRGLSQMYYRRMQRTGLFGRTRQETGSLVRMGGGYLTQRVDGEKKLHHVRVAEAAIGPLPPSDADVGVMSRDLIDQISTHDKVGIQHCNWKFSTVPAQSSTS